MHLTKEQHEHMVWMLKSDQERRAIINDGDYAKKILGISKSYYCELKSGRKDGGRKVAQFAKALNLSVDYLLGIQALIPIKGNISLLKPIDEFTGDDKMLEHIDGCSLPGFRYEYEKKYYALRIADNSLSPNFCVGDVLIIEKNSFRNIANYSRVIYTDETRQKWLKYIEIIDNNYFLRSYSPGESIHIPSEKLNHIEIICFIAISAKIQAP